MDGFEINGTRATGGANGNYELKAHDDKNKFVNSSFGDGFGAASGGQVDKPQTGVINTYGGDIANFAKFKGNDKNDAMRLTNSAAQDIKKLYMQLQHEFPGIELQFEPMPNPQTLGKKREGFFNYQQQLDNWKDNAMTLINNARERNTVQVVGDAAKEVMANDNRNAKMNAAVTVATGEAVMDNDNANAADINANVDREGAATRKAVHNEGAATRGVVKQEGAKTRSAVHAEGRMTRFAVHAEGTMTRNTIRIEGAKTRDTVRKTGHETQELDTATKNVYDSLNQHTHEDVSKIQVRSMCDKIVSSKLPHDVKKELLDNLAAFSGRNILNDYALNKMRTDIENRIATESTLNGELPGYEEVPEQEIPIRENPFPDVVGSGGEPSTSSRGTGKNPNIGGKPPVETEKEPEDRNADTPPSDGEIKIPFAPPKPKVLEPKFKKK